MEPKPGIEPMRLVSVMNRAPRCGARTRRWTPCRQPKVRGRPRCWMHGARAGAPEGPANGRYVHGQRSGAVLAERAFGRALLKLARAELTGLAEAKPSACEGG